MGEAPSPARSGSAGSLTLGPDRVLQLLPARTFMTTDPPDASPDAAELLKDAPNAWDAAADSRRRLALRAWRAWPDDLPFEIGPPPGATGSD